MFFLALACPEPGKSALKTKKPTKTKTQKIFVVCCFVCVCVFFGEENYFSWIWISFQKKTSNLRKIVFLEKKKKKGSRLVAITVDLAW